VISGGRRIGLEALDERAARAAAGLKSLGVGRGDLIAIYLRNDFPFFEASFAAGLIGAYPTPVNWHSAADEARYLFENSGARAIVIHADLVEPIRSVFPDRVPVFVVPTPPEVAAAYGVAPEACAVPAGMTDWTTWLEGFEPYDGPSEAAPGTIIYTSGTTGYPNQRNQWNYRNHDQQQQQQKCAGEIHDVFGEALPRDFGCGAENEQRMAEHFIKGRARNLRAEKVGDEPDFDAFEFAGLDDIFDLLEISVPGVQNHAEG
jgi:acyl-CoA synthetase (AMP-forming)/AMP-acid ligase II